MRINAFVAKLVQDVRASYWFLPASLVCLALLVSQASLFIDRNPEWLPFEPPQAFRNTHVEGARSLLSIVAQSIFGVAGVLFSMTIAAVSFASGNFGPRLIGNFMRDRGNQWSLGILIMTFVFALMILRAIQGGGVSGADEVFVPHLSIFLALILTLVSVFTVIYFVHHIPETINVSNITAALGRRLVGAIKKVIEAQGERSEEGGAVTWPRTEAEANVTLSKTGYIQALNTQDLRDLAEKNDLCIQVMRPIGSFVTHDTVVLRVWGKAAGDEAVRREIRTAFALGASPTEAQNLMFVVDQLVEMIARAMSPGMNDPFTAINCLNWLHAAAVTGANYEGGLLGETQGAVRLRRPEFRDILQGGFGAAYPYVSSDALCLSHVTGIFVQMKEQIEDSAHRDTLKEFLAQLDEG
ncbi:DUF2254 domain-containing protein [Rhodobacteraceae bacterium D3-12]|nr:DUF2254 domain-containing protein [Rhodobacteraceae bacterium D3-12]